MERNLVGIEHDRVTNVASTDFPGYYPGEDHSWDLNKFKKTFDIKIHKYDEEEHSLNFDLIGIDTSIANAFRRIMIAEIPSLAIENVYVFNNTSVIQDEVLAHRLGLIPLNFNPDDFIWVDPSAGEEGFDDKNTVVLSLNIICKRNPNPKNEDDEFINSNVYAKDLVFEPQGSQIEKYKYKNGENITTNPNILIAKLRPGQEISLKMHCRLGLGSDHAKFSPVATASYRLLPAIKLLEPIIGSEAEELKKCFPSGVIEIDESGKAYVADPRKDTVSREVLRHENLANKVKLGRRRDHFIFNVESTGAMTPQEIFFKSVRILKNKTLYLKKCPIKRL